MRNNFLKSPLFILLTISLFLSIFIYVSSRISGQIKIINKNVEETTQSLNLIIKVHRDIVDFENITNSYLQDPKPSIAEAIKMKQAVINLDIKNLKQISKNESDEMRRIDSLQILISKRAQLTEDLINTRSEKGMEAAIALKTSYDFKFYLEKTQSVLRFLEEYENMEMQKDLNNSELNVIRFNWLLISVFIVICVFAFSNFLQLIKSNNQKKKEAENSNYLDLVLSSISDAVITTDLNFKVLGYNKAAEKLYGFDTNVIGSDITEAVRTQITVEEVNKIRDAMITNGFWKGEVKHLNAEGDEIIVLSIRSAIKDKYGRITGFVSSNRDITERKLADNLLSQFSQQLTEQVKSKTEELTNIFERISDAFIALDKNWRYTYINSNAEQILNKTREEVIGKNIWDLFPEGKDQAFHMAYEKAMRTQEFVYLQEYYSPSDRWFENYIYPSFTGLSVYIRDITEKKKIEITLKENEKKYRSLVEQSLTGIYITKNEKFIYVNPQFAKIFGYSQEEMLGGLNISYVIHESDLNKVLDIARKRIEGKNVASNYQFRGVKKDGSIIHLEVFGSRAEQAGEPVIIGTLLDITKRIKTAEEIRKSNERFNLISKATNDAVWEWNLETNEVWGNESHQQLYGRTIADPGPSAIEWQQRLHIEDRDRLISINKSILDSDKSTMVNEYRFYSENNGWINIYDRTYIDRDETGKPIRMLGTMMDITERKKAEKALKDSEEKYRSLIDQASESIIIYSFDGTVHEYNQVAQQISGYSKDEFSKLKLSDFLIGDVITDQQKYHSLLAGNTETIYRQLKRKDGIIVDMEIVARLIAEDRVLAFGRDISERKRNEETIKKEKEKYRMLFDNNPLPLWMFSLEDFRFIDVNKAATQYYGYSKKEFLNMTIFDIRSAKEKRKRKKAINEESASQIGRRIWKHLKKNGEEIYVEVSYHDTIYNNKPVRLALSVDITEKLEAEKLLKKSFGDIKRLSTHLEQVREEERINIAREIHDELGQQLTVLKMDISWLNKKIETEDHAIRNRLNNLIDIIDKTVVTVRKISSDLRPSILDDLGLSEALEWQCQQFEIRSGIKTRFKSDVNNSKFPVLMATGLFRIFQECLTNIARHSEATLVKSHLKRTNEKLLMTITDNGKGFVINDIENKRTLGILGMKERVRILNGEYKIKSEPGKGTLVEICIPIKKEFIKNND